MIPGVRERMIATNGVQLRTLEAGPPGGPLVVLAHGFPELAFSWRHQIGVLAAAGYHVLTPDQRGYGGSSRPAEVDAYAIDQLTADLIGLLDDAGAEKAVFVGHDWGSIVTWTLPLLYPQRVAAVAGLSGPPVPRPRRPPTDIWRDAAGANFSYLLYFQQPGVADAELSRDTATTMRRVLAAPHFDRDQLATMQRPGPLGYVDRLPEPTELPPWLPQDELDVYVGEFLRTGFTGALNWYRNFDRNWELTSRPPTSTITAPAVFIAGADDPVLTFARTDRSREVVTGPYREIIVPGAGHCIQQERPDIVNAALLDLLSTSTAS